jgi:hypothetical protein
MDPYALLPIKFSSQSFRLQESRKSGKQEFEESCMKYNKSSTTLAWGSPA